MSPGAVSCPRFPGTPCPVCPVALSTAPPPLEVLCPVALLSDSCSSFATLAASRALLLLWLHVGSALSCWTV